MRQELGLNDLFHNNLFIPLSFHPINSMHDNYCYYHLRLNSVGIQICRKKKHVRAKRTNQKIE